MRMKYKSQILQKEETMNTIIKTRRDFLKQSMYVGAAVVAAGPLSGVLAQGMAGSGSKMKFGLVTYLWGRDWDLPTVIANCEKTKVLGVELRTEHAHGVESNLNARQRRDVKKRFDDSPVTLLGPGANFAFHHADASRLRKDIEGAKEYIKLSRDCGGTGIKVKPNDLPRNVPQEKTIEQIGKSLNELGRFGADYGQQIRLEVHGACAPLPIIKKIMDVADNPNVGVCWNCNGQDLDGEGLEYNFNLVKDRFGDTAHVRELNIGSYPYQELMNLFVAMDYDGWILLEARTNPGDRVKALAEQRQVFGQMIAKAQGGRRSGRGGVQIDDVDKKLRITINGKLFTEYNYQDVPRPYFYPVIGPTGVPVNRHWPMKDINPDEAQDHVHHKSLWFTHGEVNGQDFWGEGSSRSGNIVHDKFLKVSSGRRMGEIVSTNKWVAKDGKVVCTDTRTHRFYNRRNAQSMDIEITIHASEARWSWATPRKARWQSVWLRQCGAKERWARVISSTAKATPTAAPGASGLRGATTTGRSTAGSSAWRYSTILRIRNIRRGGTCVTTGCSRPIRSASVTSRKSRGVQAILQFRPERV